MPSRSATAGYDTSSSSRSIARRCLSVRGVLEGVAQYAEHLAVLELGFRAAVIVRGERRGVRHVELHVLPAAAAQLGERVVDRDRVRPGREAAVAAVGVQSIEDANDAVLGKVVEDRVVDVGFAGERSRQATADAAAQCSQCGVVAGAQVAQPLVVRPLLARHLGFGLGPASRYAGPPRSSALARNAERLGLQRAVHERVELGWRQRPVGAGHEARRP